VLEKYKSFVKDPRFIQIKIATQDPFKIYQRENFVEYPCDQGTKIEIPKVFRRIPKNSSTNICGVPRNSDSYPPNTLAIRVRLLMRLSS
jgi:hypothetical protein